MTSNGNQMVTGDSLTMGNIDLALLEEICEEAMEMTIKEALLHSVDPKVRKNLLEGQFTLTPAEVRGLEIYCEALIGNLVTESIEGSVSSLNDRNARRTSRVAKLNTAKELSEVDLEILMRNCEKILECIITESLQDSSRILSSEKSKSKNLNKMSLEEMQAEDIVSALVDFQGSKNVQKYIGHLTADIVKTALSKVAVTMAACQEQKNVEGIDNKFTTSTMFDVPETNYNKLSGCIYNRQPDKRADDGFINSESKTKETDNQTHSFLNGARSDSFHRKQNGNTYEYFSESDVEGHNVEHGVLSLEYDAEWENHGNLMTDELNDESRASGKQRILLEELSFDETAKVRGSELMAPVFLAIAEEDLYDDDEEFQHMRRKAQSIEDLCHIIKDEEVSDTLPRSISLQNLSKAQGYTPFLFQTGDTSPFKSFSDSLSDADDEFDESDDISDEENEQEYIKKIGSASVGPCPMSPLGASKEYRWHTVTLAGREKVLDLKALEPYMKVITHGGYYKKEGKSVIVVITAYYLPDRNNPNYQFLMEQLFFYVMSTVELLATTTDYYIVYLNGGTTQKNTPSVNWMKKFYRYIDRHQRKNMLQMFVVHPTFWLKALIRLAKPFMSPQFWQKLDFVHSLRELAEHVPLEYMFIPDEVVRSDPLYRQQHGL